MCLAYSRIKGLNRWNWDGDEIIPECVVPSSRPIVGEGGDSSYDIDVREFLITEDNEVVKRPLRETLRRYAQSLSWGNWDLFCSRGQGSFDHRANIVASFIGDRISYKRAAADDPWMFPDETLSLAHGDCEDRAFLLASLLIGSGISDYNVRVALGHVIDDGGRKQFGHAWVMYKNEEGRWMLLEPMLGAAAQKGRYAPAVKHPRRDRVEYRPQFVFNNRHLWAMHGTGNTTSFSDSVVLRREWQKLDPAFAGEAHFSILNQALKQDPQGNPASGEIRAFIERLNSYFHTKFGYILDDIDAKRPYDPLDHFDNGLIQESLNQLWHRTEIFKTSKSPDTFALIAHSIGDFYAHTSYGNFAALDSSLRDPSPAWEIYDTEKFSTSGIKYDGSRGYNLTNWDLSRNSNKWQGSARDRAAVWEGKIISGRFAQPDDDDVPKPQGLSPAEWVGYFMEPGSVDSWASAYYLSVHPEIASLPHHYEVAVDEESIDSRHVLYTKQKLADRFLHCRNTAIHHIRKVFYGIWKSPR